MFLAFKMDNKYMIFIITGLSSFYFSQIKRHKEGNKNLDKISDDANSHKAPPSVFNQDD